MEDSEIVSSLKRWLDKQMDSGSFGEMPEDEILKQVREYEQARESYRKSD